MLESAQIERMSTAERLRAMEQLWDALVREPEGVASPPWHRGARRPESTGGAGGSQIPDAGAVAGTPARCARMTVVVFEDAAGDLETGRRFYERREPGVGGLLRRVADVGFGGFGALRWDPQPAFRVSSVSVEAISFWHLLRTRI
jgi:hypothetical protein